MQKCHSLGRSRFAASVLCVALCASGGRAYAQTAPTAPAGDEIVKLPTFSVSTERDYGYRASNSIAGSRTNTPIKDLPVNIQVFTKDLMDDLGLMTQVDLEAYNGSLVNGGFDRNSNNAIQQAYNAFLFRGFQQNWGLRDGIREYDPVDLQGIARVEVVKGPVAALYGLTYPGGVMQNITKAVEFGRNFARTTASMDSEGEMRASLDSNIVGDLGGTKFGIRLNAVNQPRMVPRNRRELFDALELTLVRGRARKVPRLHNLHRLMPPDHIAHEPDLPVSPAPDAAEQRMIRDAGQIGNGSGRRDSRTGRRGHRNGGRGRNKSRRGQIGQTPGCSWAVHHFAQQGPAERQRDLRSRHDEPRKP